MNKKFAHRFFTIAAFTFSFILISQITYISPRAQNPKKVFAKKNNLCNKQIDTNISYKVPAHAVLLYTKTNNVCKKAYPYTAYLQDDLFNPLTASNEELKAHGYPTRPKNKEHLKIWNKSVSVKLVKPVLTPIKDGGGHSIIVNSETNTKGHKGSNKLK